MSALTMTLVLGDIVSQGIISDQHISPWRQIRHSFVAIDGQLSHVSDALDLDRPEPRIYGRLRRIPDVDPASPQGFQWQPIYLGKEMVGSPGVEYHVWMVCGHACADLPEVLAWTHDEFGALDTFASLLADSDWLIPHTSAPEYEDRRSTYGNDRRYTLIRGRVGNTEADACADGTMTLTCFVDGVEPNGDGSGAVITDRILQYAHWLINDVANRGPASYQSGAWLTSPTWDVFGTPVPIIDESSFAACDAIAKLRLPATIGSPGEPAGYIGAAIIGAGPSDRKPAKAWIADWNRSCGVQFTITRLGQVRVFMLHPTEAIKAAAPLITDAYEVLEGSFETPFGWGDKVNRVPFRADYEHTSGQWKTSGVASNDVALEQYGGVEIQGDVREYPFAPGITAANHLAVLESRVRAHPSRTVILQGTVGPNPVDQWSLGYLEIGDYFRYRHFAALGEEGQIRLAQVIRHQVQAGRRTVLIEGFDCEDLIDYDAGVVPTFPPGEGEAASCETAVEIPEATATGVGGYTVTVDTSGLGTDLSAPITSCGGGAAYHAYWAKYTPTYAQKGHITTGLSTYDTVLAVFTGSCGELEELACNDNSIPGVFNTSFIEFTGSGPMIFEAGVTHYILVHGFAPSDGGTLVLTLFGEPL